MSPSHPFVPSLFALLAVLRAGSSGPSSRSRARGAMARLARAQRTGSGGRAPRCPSSGARPRTSCGRRRSRDAGTRSPIVWGDRIFVTTAIEGELVPGSPRMQAPRSRTAPTSAIPMPWATTTSTPSRCWRWTPATARSSGSARPGRACPRLAAQARELRIAHRGHRRRAGLRLLRHRGSLRLRFRGQPGLEVRPRALVGSASVGLGTSPVLYKDLVILLCDEENGEKSFIVGLDRRTGKEVWRTPRKIELSWATPVLVSANGRDELVTAGNEANIAYDPATGRELWRTKGLENNAVGTPLVGDGVVVIYSGYPDKISMAVKPGGTGDVTDADALALHEGLGLRSLGDPLRRPRLPDYRQGPRDLPRRQDRAPSSTRASASGAREPHGLAGGGRRPSPAHEPGRRHLRGDGGAEVRGGAHRTPWASPSAPRLRWRADACTSAARSTSSRSAAPAGPNQRAPL